MKLAAQHFIKMNVWLTFNNVLKAYIAGYSKHKLWGEYTVRQWFGRAWADDVQSLCCTLPTCYYNFYSREHAKVACSLYYNVFYLLPVLVCVHVHMCACIVHVGSVHQIEQAFHSGLDEVCDHGTVHSRALDSLNSKYVFNVAEHKQESHLPLWFSPFVPQP